MADDRRRRARVQAKWAERPANRTPIVSRPAAVQPCGCCALQQTCNKNTLSKESSLVFVDSVPVLKKKPSDLFIDKEGNHILSHTSDDKVCSIQLYPDFLDDKEENKTMFDCLLKTVPWQQKWCASNGERLKMPRLVAWYGPIPYQFSGATLSPVLQHSQWPPIMKYLHDRIHASFGYEFNSVLLNLYEDGKSSVAWHSDDELLLGVHPVIASISLGETRIFEMRKKADDGNYDTVQHVKVPLKDGSLLIMEGETQSHWQHRIPKEFHDRKARINLTFRTVFNKTP